MAKIYFIYFDIHTGYYPSFNHGLAYLIGVLRRAHQTVLFSRLSCESEFITTGKILEKEKPDVVGLSFTTNQKKYVSRFIKAARPSAKLIIAGGVGCTLEPEQTFTTCSAIDGICIGEGEAAVKELCQRIDAHREYLTTPSFYFNTKEGIVKNRLMPLQDVDALQLPDYSLFNYDIIIAERGNCFPMLLSRGCPHDCAYCCNDAIRHVYTDTNRYVRFPTVRSAVDIIKNNLKIYPKTQKIFFDDDIFTLNSDWLRGFCELYKKEINVPFLCKTRVESINEEILTCLKGAGCVSLEFGVETGNEWLRNNILNRRQSNEKIKKVFQMTKQYGIKQFAFNMVGLPFETKEMARETVRFNFDLQPNYGTCFYFYPYPGTRLYELCRDYNMLLNNYESRSGYLEAPALSEMFMSFKEAKKNFELLRIFFYTRLLFYKLKIDQIPMIEKVVIGILFILRKPILFLLDPSTKSILIRKLRNGIRIFVYKYLR